MFACLRHRGLGACLTLALLLATLTGAFAHRAVPAPQDARLAAFLLAGGTTDDICAAGDAAHEKAGAVCALCRLVADALVPTPDGLPRDAGLRLLQRFTAAPDPQMADRTPDGPPMLRGPPRA